MALAELGLKRTCVACGARFYDLTKTPAVCPKCGTEQPAEQPRARRAASPLPEEKPRKRAAAVEGADTDEIEVDDADAEVAEDAEDLDEDEDLAEDIGVEGADDEES
ncbi:TIGR02300 family protein [Roseomonas indoligenes]|uniref:TIGR02300 family protein n=1 Tax=Roseomonas indoligenes TaxID=2820811 RepID=A0A940S4U6_9PROT|nr:TIGR02300 family protein [Pararoseomonas indoligenes]MBP0493691.1 TIGR02300 family protein [Pararoseomonas indoligenes]